MASVPAPKVFALLQRRAGPDAQRLRAAFPGVRFVPARESWKDAVAEADAAVLGYGIKVDELLERAPKLRWIHTESAGVDRILTPRFLASGVVLTKSAGVHGVPIAEHVLALMFSFARQLPVLGRAQANRLWLRPEPSLAFELQGQTLAVLGLGAIGQTLARKAQALGLRVLGLRRDPLAGPVDGVAEVLPISRLDEALAQADHVAICLPLTPETHGLFNDARFAALKPGAFLYNIGRGRMVDQGALLRALDGGRLAGAGLDVTDPEPLPLDSPLWQDPRVIVTNHTSGSSEKNPDRTLALLEQNLGRALRGEPLLHVVDPAREY
jgi:phosphoglycerate dehydrogenase-like enzyme